MKLFTPILCMTVFICCIQCSAMEDDQEKKAEAELSNVIGTIDRIGDPLIFLATAGTAWSSHVLGINSCGFRLAFLGLQLALLGGNALKWYVRNNWHNQYPHLVDHDKQVKLKDSEFYSIGGMLFTAVTAYNIIGGCF